MKKDADVSTQYAVNSSVSGVGRGATVPGFLTTLTSEPQKMTSACSCGSTVKKENGRRMRPVKR